MPNLVIDIGNTRVKSALFEKAELVWEGIFDEIEEALDSWSDNKSDHCLVQFGSLE